MTTRYSIDRARFGTRFNSGGGRSVARDAEFKESDHPRAPNGQFGQGSGSSKAAAPAPAPASAPSPAPAPAPAAPAPAAEKSSQATEIYKSISPASNSSTRYKAPSKTEDEIIAGVPGAKEAVAIAKQKLKEGKPTNALVKDGGFMQEDGNYTPERQAVHRKILRDIFTKEAMEKYTPKNGEPAVLTILGGRGGSGKGWFTKPGGIIDTDKTLVIDSDKIKEALPEYQGWNAAHLHEEASHIVKLVDKFASKHGMNVTLDGTLKSLDSIQDRIAQYHSNKEANYSMVGRYMQTNPDISASRALDRFSKDGKFNGRFVPPEVILKNTKNEENFDKLSSSFKEWSVYQNNGASPELVSEHK